MDLHRIRIKKRLLAEISLIISSVLIFRSLWLLMDMVSFFRHTAILAALLVIGIATSVPAMHYLIKKG